MLGLVLNISLLSLLCRYGKQLVLDMMEMNLVELIERRFDEIQPQLYQQLMTKDIIKDRKYVLFILLLGYRGDLGYVFKVHLNGRGTDCKINCHFYISYLI